ncbi:MAG: aspartate kinase, partial [Flavobacteriales bacterium]
LCIDSDSWRHHFSELHKTLTHPIFGSFDRTYDSIVSYGELFSSSILHSYIEKQGIHAQWLDARRIIRTDDRFRDARVDFKACEMGTLQKWKQGNSIGITQGFIGANEQGNTTTLGREGSDYSASVLGYLTQAREVVIWKDVPGMMNADPRWFPEAQKVARISYHEAVELAYYGASVIHPKTIKPLQNLGIPLFIKSFENPSEEGTIIFGERDGTHPMYHLILKTWQALVSVSPTDFSFIVEDNLRDIFDALSSLGIRIRLMENSAISFSFVTDNDERKMEELQKLLEGKFIMRFNGPVTLLTIRHWTTEVAEHYTSSRQILLEQRNRTALRLVMRPTPAELVPQKS